MEARSQNYWKILAIFMLLLNTLLLLMILLKPTEVENKFGPKDGGPGKFIIDKLQFNENQIQLFEELKSAHHEEMIRLRKEGRRMREDFYKSLSDHTVLAFDNNLANKIAENQKQIDIVTYNHFEDVKKICDPKQVIIFNEIIVEITQQMMNPRKGPPPPNDGPKF